MSEINNHSCLLCQAEAALGFQWPCPLCLPGGENAGFTRPLSIAATRRSSLHCRPIKERRRDVERRLGGGGGGCQHWRAAEVWRGRAEPRPRAHAQDDGGDGVRLHLLLDALLGHHHVVSE